MRTVSSGKADLIRDINSNRQAGFAPTGRQAKLAAKRGAAALWLLPSPGAAARRGEAHRMQKIWIDRKSRRREIGGGFSAYQIKCRETIN